MINDRQSFLGRFMAFLLWTAIVLWCSVGHAAEPSAGTGQALLSGYPAIRTSLEKNQFGAPIRLESVEASGTLRVDMYGILQTPFAAVRVALLSPAGWCDITSLHVNIKACTWNRAEDYSLLTLYSGRKYYQPPADAYQLKLKFRVVSQQPDYFDLALTANEGPLHTKDHRIRLEAAPLNAGQTLVHLSYAYSHGPVANIAIKTYFATIARDKVGFSLIEAQDGKRYYVDGVRGSIERNTMRYYLALETYLDALNYPKGQRFERRIARWYDLTARYPRQLKEMEKADYLAEKRREHNNQLLMQRQ
jgi:hypothetical protein